MLRTNDSMPAQMRRPLARRPGAKNVSYRVFGLFLLVCAALSFGIAPAYAVSVDSTSTPEPAHSEAPPLEAPPLEVAESGSVVQHTEEEGGADHPNTGDDGDAADMEMPEAGDEQLTVEIEYTLGEAGVMLGGESLSRPLGGLITSRDLNVPAGFQLRDPFPDYTVYQNVTLVLVVERKEAPKPRYTVTVIYEHEGVEVGRQVKDELPENFVIHDEDLVIPAGYVQHHPMPPHTVVADATLTVPVILTPAVLVDITVWFLHGEERVGLQIYQQLPIGAVITEDTLVLPEGFRLAEPFADYRVTAAAELFLRVVTDPAVIEPTPTPTPTLTQAPTPTTPAPTETADRPGGPAPELANTGASGVGPMLNAALAASVLGLILLGRHRRQQSAG